MLNPLRQFYNIMTKSEIKVVIHSILILHLLSCNEPNEEMCSFKALIEIPAGTALNLSIIRLLKNLNVK